MNSTTPNERQKNNNVSSGILSQRSQKMLRTIDQLRSDKHHQEHSRSESKSKGFTGKDYEEFASSRRTIIMALGIVVTYIFIGALVFGLWVDGWSAVDAIYFTVATFTTVGYGDLYPETQGQRIFGIFFVAGGIMVIGGVVLGIVFDALFETMQKSVAEKKAGTQTLFMEKLFRPNKEDDNEEDDGHRNESSSVVSAAVSKNKMLMGAAIAGAIFIPALTIGHFEDWSIVDSIYYAIVTATTVGYGDLSPKRLGTRIAAVFYLPLCVATMAKVFNIITGRFLDRKAEKAESQFFNRVMNLEDLEQMDFGGDGKVNREEFLIFMLVAMGKVDEGSIVEIMELFEKLDRDGDQTLEVSDIMASLYGDKVVKEMRSNLGRSLNAADFAGV